MTRPISLLLAGALVLVACADDEAATDESLTDATPVASPLEEPTPEEPAAPISDTTGPTIPETTAPSSPTSLSVPDSDRYPAVLDVEATFDGDSMTWTFAVTMSSPYDTPERYADGWRVVGPDGTVYGVHTLAHDHAAEQPFTRHQSRVAIPDDVTEVTIEGRDLANGFGGPTKTIVLQTG